jgi:hypothetical protein
MPSRERAAQSKINEQTARAAGKGGRMVKTFEDVQRVGADGMDASLKSIGAVQKGFQAIAVEVSDYSKNAFEQGTAAVEKLMGAKSLDTAVLVQSDYVKTAYEAFVAQATKLGELYADLAHETYKPFEGYLKTAAAK